MRICAHNPSNSEYTLCGMAEDAPQTEQDEEPFSFAAPGQRVTCENCLSAILEIHVSFTRSGKMRK